MLSRDIKIKKYNSVTMDLILDFTIPETVKIKKFGIDAIYEVVGNLLYTNKEIIKAIENKTKSLHKITINTAEGIEIDLKNPAGVGTCYKDVLKPIDEHKSSMTIALVNTTSLDTNEKYILHVIEYDKGNYIDHSGVYKIKNLPSYLVNTFDGENLTTDKSRNILEDTKKEFLKSLNNKLVDDLLSNYRYFYNGI
jgi:hypothetical protein